MAAKGDTVDPETTTAMNAGQWILVSSTTPTRVLGNGLLVEREQLLFIQPIFGF
jgi:hypothetical protein